MIIITILDVKRKSCPTRYEPGGGLVISRRNEPGGRQEVAVDYRGRHVSSIAQEKKRNPRLGQQRTLEQFRDIMNNLNLPYPKFIDYAVPGNLQCGVCPNHLPENLEKYCGHMTESPQG